jgi:hypothetical protein
VLLPSCSNIVDFVGAGEVKPGEVPGAFACEFVVQVRRSGCCFSVLGSCIEVKGARFPYCSGTAGRPCPQTSWRLQLTELACERNTRSSIAPARLGPLLCLTICCTGHSPWVAGVHGWRHPQVTGDKRDVGQWAQDLQQRRRTGHFPADGARLEVRGCLVLCLPAAGMRPWYASCVKELFACGSARLMCHPSTQQDDLSLLLLLQVPAQIAPHGHPPGPEAGKCAAGQ